MCGNDFLSEYVRYQNGSQSFGVVGGWRLEEKWNPKTKFMCIKSNFRPREKHFHSSRHAKNGVTEGDTQLRTVIIQNEQVDN